MKRKYISIPLCVLILSTVLSIPLNFMPTSVRGLPGPSLVVDDSMNRIQHSGIAPTSQITVKGTVTNIDVIPWAGLLTGVFVRQDGPPLVPGQLTFDWSPDGIVWNPAGPGVAADPATGYQIELVIGPPGGYALPINGTSTTYIRVTATTPIGPSVIPAVAVIVWQDQPLGIPYHWDAPFDLGWILTQPPGWGGLINWDNPIKLDLAVVHTAEIDGTGQFFYSIQSAINVASPSNTIYVYPGTYNEALTINQAVSVVSIQGAAQTVIDGTGLVIASGLVTINAPGNAEFRGFTVQNAPQVGVVRFGIFSTGPPGATYQILNNIIYGSNNPAETDDYGFYAQSGAENIIFRSNTIQRTASNPICLELHTGATEISGNTLENQVGAASDVIFFMTYNAADVTALQNVSYNTFNMNKGAIFDYAHRSGAISFNTPGLAWGLGDAKFTNVVIEGNTISNLAPYRRGIGFWNGGGGGGGTIAPLIKSNTITGYSSVQNITFPWTESYGINFVGAGSAVNAIILYNSIRYCDKGVYLRTADCAPGLTIHYNNIRNCNQGVNNTVGTSDVDARFNYWGAASGPYHPTSNPAGSKLCNVTDNVLFNPWSQYIYPAPPPETHDLFVDYLTATPDVFQIGTHILIQLRVISTGTYFEENVTVTIRLDSNPINITVLRYVAPPITIYPASYSNLIELDYDTTGLSAGSHIVSATVTPVPGETNTNNNLASIGVLAGTGQFPTLQAPVVRMQRLDKLFQVNITVNDLLSGWQGVSFQYRLTWNPELMEFVDITEGPFLLDPLWNFYNTYFITDVTPNGAGQNTSVIVGQLLLPDSNGYTPIFPYGDGVLAILTFKTLQQEAGIWRPPLTCDLTLTETLVLNPDGLVIPASVQNGRFEMLPDNTADINDDYKVDMKDIGRAAKAFGTIPGDPRWDPTADVTGPTTWIPDGKVDMRDLGLIARNFGWEAIDC